MMKIKGQNITHMRGDTGCIDIILYSNGNPYTMQDGDTLTFSVKRNINDSDYVVQKTSKSNKVIFQHSDTKDLQPGNYVYDIQVQTALGQVQTIGPAKYVIQADITRQ